MPVPPDDVFHARLAALRAAFGPVSLDGLLVTSLPNVSYLTGLFASSGALLVLKESLHLITDGRYAEVARQRLGGVPGAHVRLVGLRSYDETMADELRGLQGRRIGIEAEHLSLQRYRTLVANAQGDPDFPELVETAEMVEDLRLVKDAWEVKTLREAGGRLSEAAKRILPRVLAGEAERTIAAMVESELRRVGFDRLAFDTIVASGANSALPHYRAGDKRIEVGDLVVVDFGGVLHGYAVDMTRTIVAGREPDARQREVLEAVAAAAGAAFREVNEGVPPEQLDRAARGVLERAGMGEAFSHGTGHGLGLEVHERPRIARAAPGLPGPPLRAGMVFTLEPGAYFPGWGGVRIEDDVLVTASGGEKLTTLPSLGFE